MRINIESRSAGYVQTCKVEHITDLLDRYPSTAKLVKVTESVWHIKNGRKLLAIVTEL